MGAQLPPPPHKGKKVYEDCLKLALLFSAKLITTSSPIGWKCDTEMKHFLKFCNHDVNPMIHKYNFFFVPQCL